MPDQHCPTCGAARSAGCRCLPDPALTETAVLPHLEGPPLVRPYVPLAAGQVAGAPAPGATADPFATTLLPPTAPPAGPDADAYATTVLPPVMSVPQQAPPAQPPPYGQQAPYGQQPYDPQHGYDEQHAQYPHDPQHPYGGAEEPAAEGREEIGLFAFAGTATDAHDGSARTGGRAARRAQEQAAGSPLTRRRGLVVAAGAGLLALTVGLAYAVTPSGEPERQAQPLPSRTLAPAPVDPTTPAPPPSPSAPPSSTEAPSPTPSRTAKPSRTTAPTPTAAPTTVAAPPAAAPTTPPAPTPTPTPTPTATTPTPTPTPTARVLERGMSGPDVKDMQLRLSAASCGFVDKSIATGTFDWWTQSVLADFQRSYKIKGEVSAGAPVYGPKTRAALESDPGDC
ncbi:peptidoglycan-binding domain-containing protein [Kitasatospora sp. NPDC090091]|uniref:peptidoglycan-binding domain-containing protein n=1 Tax=Kitasatospora sp. NPDC090091 TaxID=3364081 RepID=UPI003801E551